MVEPTPLKNMLVKMGSSSPIFGVKIKKIFELPPPRYPNDTFHPKNPFFYGQTTGHVTSRRPDNSVFGPREPSKVIATPRAGNFKRLVVESTWMSRWK